MKQQPKKSLTSRIKGGGRSGHDKNEFADLLDDIDSAVSALAEGISGEFSVFSNTYEIHKYEDKAACTVLISSKEKDLHDHFSVFSITPGKPVPMYRTDLYGGSGKPPAIGIEGRIDDLYAKGAAEKFIASLPSVDRVKAIIALHTKLEAERMKKNPEEHETACRILIPSPSDSRLDIHELKDGSIFFALYVDGELEKIHGMGIEELDTDACYVDPRLVSPEVDNLVSISLSMADPEYWDDGISMDPGDIVDKSDMKEFKKHSKPLNNDNLIATFEGEAMTSLYPKNIKALKELKKFLFEIPD